MNTESTTTAPDPTTASSGPARAPARTTTCRAAMTALIAAASVGLFLFGILRTFYEDALTGEPTGYAPDGIALIETLAIAATHLLAAALVMGLRGGPTPWHSNGRTLAAGAAAAMAVAVTLPWLTSDGIDRGVRPIDLSTPLRASSETGVFSTPLLLGAIVAFAWAALRGDRRGNTVAVTMASIAIVFAGMISARPDYDGQHVGLGWWLSVATILTVVAATRLRTHPIGEWAPRCHLTPNTLSWSVYAAVSFVFATALGAPTPEPPADIFVLDTSGVESTLRGIIVAFHLSIGLGLLAASATRATWLRLAVVCAALAPVLAIAVAIHQHG